MAYILEINEKNKDTKTKPKPIQKQSKSNWKAI